MSSGPAGAGPAVRTSFLALAAGLAIGCSGTGSPTAAVALAAAATEPARVVVLDSGNFEALVLAQGRPSLVEFHSPT